MYPATPTYWIEPTETEAWGLRRYSRSGNGWTCAEGYHQALVYLERIPVAWQEREDGSRFRTIPRHTEHDDPRWPKVCDKCGVYEFTDADEWQDWIELIYRRPSDGAEFVLHQSAGADALGAPSAPPGASWDATWLDGWPTPDGIHLMVLLPNGHTWHVDAQASNCTRKDEEPRRHFCWIRSGDPRACNVTAGKQGDTCSAGAGSILSGDYHGFLRDGILTAG